MQFKLNTFNIFDAGSPDITDLNISKILFLPLLEGYDATSVRIRLTSSQTRNMFWDYIYDIQCSEKATLVVNGVHVPLCVQSDYLLRMGLCTDFYIATEGTIELRALIFSRKPMEELHKSLVDVGIESNTFIYKLWAPTAKVSQIICSLCKDELIERTWAPHRVLDWCTDIHQREGITRIFRKTLC